MATTVPAQRATKPDPQTHNNISHPIDQPAARFLGHTPDDYTTLVTFISSVGVFGGAITFSVLFSFVGEGKCKDEHIPKILGYSSVCFLGAVLGCMPILIAMHTQKAAARDAEGIQQGGVQSAGAQSVLNGTPMKHQQTSATSAKSQVRITGPLLTFVRTQAALVSLLMVLGFVCMFIAILFTGVAGPSIVGFILVLFSIIGSVCGYLNIPKSNTAIYIMQTSSLVILIIVAVVIGTRDILDIRWENKCTGTFINTE